MTKPQTSAPHLPEAPRFPVDTLALHARARLSRSIVMGGLIGALSARLITRAAALAQALRSALTRNAGAGHAARPHLPA